MKILLTGKNGQVGFELQRALAPLGEVVAVDRSQCDLGSADSLIGCIRNAKPDVIVNAAAYTAVDRAESEQALAIAINGDAPGIIGSEAKTLGATVVHYSTDYVYDGTKQAPYSEDDATNPQSVYGRSKLAGEQALINSGARHLIFRTSWVVGAHGNNFAKTILRLAQSKEQINVVADQIGAPTSAALIADITAQILGRRIFEQSFDAQGVYHLAASGETSWHNYAQHVVSFAQAQGLDLLLKPEAINAIPSSEYPTAAARPQNSRMATDKLRAHFGLTLPHWQNGVDHILQQLFRKDL